MSSPFGFLLTANPPSRRVGALVALAAVALSTLIIYPLKQVAPVVSLGVVYLPAVLIISVTWGAWLGIATAVLSAAAFNFFHLPPVGQFTINGSSNWVALVAFLVVAVIASSVAEITRARARDAEERRREADLAAEMARLLLRGDDLAEALPTAAARLAQVLGLHSAAIEMDAVEGDERSVAFPLRDGTSRLGTLLVGADASEASLRRLQERVVPSLEALLSAAFEREGLMGGVVETAALRRADTVKTALLRAVSHDLRSPLTAISAAGEAIGSPGLSPQERQEMAIVIQEESRRLSRLVDNLLDLSRLEAGAAEPRRDWTSVEELIRSALGELAAAPEEFGLSIDPELPLVSVDPVQMERAFVNVLENARRHSGGHPVSVRARAVRSLARAPRRQPPAAGRRPGRRNRRRWRGRANADRRPRDRSGGRSRAGDPPGPARARIRAVLPGRHAGRRTSRLGSRPGDRTWLRRGQRGIAARRVAARSGGHVRVRVAAREPGEGRRAEDRALSEEPHPALRRAGGAGGRRAGAGGVSAHPSPPPSAGRAYWWWTTSRRSCAR